MPEVVRLLPQDQIAPLWQAPVLDKRSRVSYIYDERGIYPSLVIKENAFSPKGLRRTSYEARLMSDAATTGYAPAPQWIFHDESRIQFVSEKAPGTTLHVLSEEEKKNAKNNIEPLLLETLRGLRALHHVRIGNNDLNGGTLVIDGLQTEFPNSISVMFVGFDSAYRIPESSKDHVKSKTLEERFSSNSLFDPGLFDAQEESLLRDPEMIFRTEQFQVINIIVEYVIGSLSTGEIDWLKARHPEVGNFLRAHMVGIDTYCSQFDRDGKERHDALARCLLPSTFPYILEYGGIALGEPLRAYVLQSLDWDIHKRPTKDDADRVFASLHKS